MMIVAKLQSFLIESISSKMKPKDKTNLLQNNRIHQQRFQGAFSTSVPLPKRIRQSSSLESNATTQSVQSQTEEYSYSSLNSARISLSSSSPKEESSRDRQQQFCGQRGKSESPTSVHEQSKDFSIKEPSFEVTQTNNYGSVYDTNPSLYCIKRYQVQEFKNEATSNKPAQTQNINQATKEVEQQISKTTQLSNHKFEQPSIIDKYQQDMPQNLLKKFDKYAQKSQKRFYAEWEQVFDSSKMNQLYQTYSPVLVSQYELQQIMQAIQQASQESICGRTFMDRAYELYYQNYGRMNKQEFQMKVVGDLLFLFREHNKKQQRYLQQHLAYVAAQKLAKKNKKKL